MTRDFNTIGGYITTTFADEQVRAYIPKALPPTPPMSTVGMIGQLDIANQAVAPLHMFMNGGSVTTGIDYVIKDYVI